MQVRMSIRDAIGQREDKLHKATLFHGSSMLLGVNCLEPGQVSKLHSHAGQEKFQLVHEGRGWFTVGEEEFEAGPGEVIWAPAGVPHGVENRSARRLVLVVGMAPPPAKS